MEKSKFVSMCKNAQQVTNVGTVYNKTRRGAYIKVRSGLTTNVYFCGTDLTNNKYIIEWVN